MSGFYDGALDISKEEATAIVSKAELRVTPRQEGPPWYTKEWQSAYEEILVNGRWLHICRTDECDDVCTWSPQPVRTSDHANLRRRLLRRIATSYGVRVGPGRFAIIDAMTDG